MIGLLQFVDALVFILLWNAMILVIAKICMYVNRRRALKRLKENKYEEQKDDKRQDCL